YAWEGDQVTGEAENSVFTHHLIQGLKTGQADTDGDGRITVDELYDYVYEQVVQQTPKQTPGKWSYKEQGEIVIARAAGAVQDEQIPSPLLELDDELESRIKQLYNKGLAAYYLKEWDKAVNYLQAVLDVHPDHQEASSKLEETKRQARLNKLYDEAQTAQEDGDWKKAFVALDTLASEAPDFKDVASKLEFATQQKKLADMYDEARQLHQAQEWQAVVIVFSEINLLEPDYPDTEGLLASAQEEVTLLERRRELENNYSSALEEMDAGNWDQASLLFSQVLETDPAYEDAQRLSALADEEIQRLEAASRQREVISTLYQEALDLYNAGSWQAALSKLDEIHSLEPGFTDPEDIRNKAQAQAQKEEREDLLSKQYDEAEVHYHKGEWLQALELYEQVLALDPNYHDTETKLSEARRQQQLAGQYAQAMKHLEAQHWQQAIKTLQEIIRSDPDYSNPIYGSAAASLARAKQEKERSELPSPPIKKSTVPITLPDQQKPSGKPKDLPR
ncbi:MAG: tetratricopeptide repeat protein, partial [Anaerolineales bacterium]|nr:tetratricopeptide repeat protein [Anaerolineales bacterium]